MIPSSGDLSASRWAKKQTYRTPSPFISPTPQLHATTATTTTPSRSPTRQPYRSPTRATAPSSLSTTNVRSRRPPTPASTRHQSLHLFYRLFLRLKWRAALLLHSHAYALDPHSHALPLTPVEADAQFRIDFFEFHTLLERVLIHLLLAVDVRVASTYQSSHHPNLNLVQPHNAINGPTNIPATGSSHAPAAHETLFGDAKALQPSHAFHANLLTALTLPSNPLQPYLGTGQPYKYIALAKDLRNGWKTATTLNPSNSPPDDDRSPVRDGLHHAHSHGHQSGRLNNPDGGAADGLWNNVNANAEDEKRLHDRLGRRYEDIMDGLNLDDLLRVILAAIGDAARVAEGDVEAYARQEANDQEEEGKRGRRRGSVEMGGVGNGIGIRHGDGDGDGTGKEAPWESWGVDEMEF